VWGQSSPELLLTGIELARAEAERLLAVVAQRALEEELPMALRDLAEA
jgi:hypothetical protein